MRGPNFNHGRPCLETKTINDQRTVSPPDFHLGRRHAPLPRPASSDPRSADDGISLAPPTSWLMDSLSQARERCNLEDKALSAGQLAEKRDPRTSHVHGTVPTARDGRPLSPPMNAPRIWVTLIPTRIHCEWFMLLSIVIVFKQTVGQNPKPRASTGRTITICTAPMEEGT
jgi:hypothetical protein